MTNQTYTPNMVTDETVAEFWRIYRANSQTEVSPCTKTALRAVMAPLWAEVQQLREAKRELAEALELALYGNNPKQKAVEALAKHGGDQ